MLNRGTCSNSQCVWRRKTCLKILLEAASEILQWSLQDHFLETLKHRVNLPRFLSLLSLHFPFRARNGGGKRISWFSPVAPVVMYKHSESPKSFYLFRSQRKPPNCDIFREKYVHTMQRDCFHRLNLLPALQPASHFDSATQAVPTHGVKLEHFQGNVLKSKNVPKVAQWPNTPKLIPNFAWKCCFLNVVNVLWL